LLIRETGIGADLELVVGGRPVRFPAVWLRDNCPCPGCVAPGTGQKLNDITDIPNGLAITRTEDAGESVLVTFGSDQHRSAFPRSWLEERAAR
jgi:gamma-butyrobetaine dioxygenase